MRERGAAIQVGAREGLGEFRCVASRSFGYDWIFFTPIGLLMLAGSCWALLDETHGWSSRGLPAACAVGGLVFACLPLIHAFDRRAGSDVPRLYCFADGVVIGRRNALTAYRWTDLAIERKSWTSGSGETYDSGTSITVRSASDGAVLAYFGGNEPGRANAVAVVALHKSAWKRAEASDS